MKTEKLIKLIENSTLSTDTPIRIVINDDGVAIVDNIVKVTSECRVHVEQSDIELNNVLFGITNPKQLSNILRTLDPDINISVSKSIMDISDNSVDVQYPLSDLSVVPDIAETRPIRLPENYTVKFNLDKETINRILKSKVALGASVISLTTLPNDCISLTINYSKNNTNVIRLQIESDIKSQIVDDVSFDADLIALILNQNKSFTSAHVELYQSSKAVLMKIMFYERDYNHSYYIPNLIIS